LDAASKANETMVFVPTGHPMLKQQDRSSVRGGIYESNYGKDEVFQFRVAEPTFSQLPNLEQIFEHRADRMAHVAPESFGEHTQDRPTATGTVQVLEEGKQPQYLQLERFRKSFALVVKHMLSRYKQFYPEGLHYYVMQEDEEGIALAEEFFAWPDEAIEDEVIIETKVSSRTMSAMLRKQEKMAWLDKIPQLYQTMFQLASMAAEPTPVAMIAARLLNGYQKIVDSVMTEFDLAKKEELNPDLMKEIPIAQNIAKAMAEMRQALQQAGQQVEQLQMENAQLGQALQAGMGGGAGPAQGPQGLGMPTQMAGM
jgi:hypothetical protein